MKTIIISLFLVVLGVAIGAIIYKGILLEKFGVVEIKLPDGNEYKVQSDFSNQTEAARRLEKLDRTAKEFISRLNKKYPDDPRALRLAKGYHSQALREGKGSPGTTSYTENKGEKIVMCLRSKKGELHDNNTLTFVFLHELSHIATDSYGHDNTFWTNFRFILEEATKMGYYKPENYNEKPVDYCGMSIYSSPLFN